MGTASATRAGRPASATATRAWHALLGPQRRAVALAPAARPRRPRRCAGSRRTRAPGFPSPTTSRSAGVPRSLGPGEEAAQGLALFAAAPRPTRRRSPRRRPRHPLRPLRPRRPPRRVTTRGGWPMATAVSGSMSVVTPVGSVRSETRTWPPMVSSLMSTSIDGRDGGRAAR